MRRQWGRGVAREGEEAKGATAAARGQRHTNLNDGLLLRLVVEHGLLLFVVAAGLEAVALHGAGSSGADGRQPARGRSSGHEEAERWREREAEAKASQETAG